MGGIFKFVLLFVLAMVFFAPPQEANALLNCFVCDIKTSDKACHDVDSSLSKECENGSDICISMASMTDLIVTVRMCGKQSDNNDININTCQIVGGSNGKVKTCICNTNDCNPSDNQLIEPIEPTTTPATTISTNSGSIYLNGWPIFQLLMFSFKIIIYYGFTQ